MCQEPAAVTQAGDAGVFGQGGGSGDGEAQLGSEPVPQVKLTVFADGWSKITGDRVS